MAIKKSYTDFNLGPEDPMTDDDTKEATLDTPREQTSRNPPYELSLNFVRYRAGKEYESK